MSPQYTSVHPTFNTNSCIPSTKARKMQQMQKEDPRYRHFDRMLARAYIGLLKKRKAALQQQAGFLAPRMDLCDDPKNTYIIAMLEVPGMKPEQLAVRIEGGRLIIQGERTGPHLHLSGQTTPAATHPPPSEPTENASAADEASTLSSLYPVRELKYGKFKRVIDLPAGVNATDIRSSLVEGMLTIQWPRNPSRPVAAGSPARDASQATL